MKTVVSPKSLLLKGKEESGTVGSFSGKDICLTVGDEDDEDEGTEDDPTDLALDRCFKHLQQHGANGDDQASNASTVHPKSFMTLHKSVRERESRTG